MTIPRLELGISRVSGERVSHCTIQSWRQVSDFLLWFIRRSINRTKIQTVPLQIRSETRRSYMGEWRKRYRLLPRSSRIQTHALQSSSRMAEDKECLPMEWKCEGNSSRQRDRRRRSWDTPLWRMWVKEDLSWMEWWNCTFHVEWVCKIVGWGIGSFPVLSVVST